eukprot:Gb_39773 [translate_table: standard]
MEVDPIFGEVKNVDADEMGMEQSGSITYSSLNNTVAWRFVLSHLQQNNILPSVLILLNVNDHVVALEHSCKAFSKGLISRVDVKDVKYCLREFANNKPGFKQLVGEEDQRGLELGIATYHNGQLPIWREFIVELINKLHTFAEPFVTPSVRECKNWSPHSPRMVGPLMVAPKITSSPKFTKLHENKPNAYREELYQDCFKDAVHEEIDTRNKKGLKTHSLKQSRIGRIWGKAVAKANYFKQPLRQFLEKQLPRKKVPCESKGETVLINLKQEGLKPSMDALA